MPAERVAHGSGRSGTGQIDYPWHGEYRELREAISQLCARFPLDYWDAHEGDGEFPDEFFRAFAEGGWLGATTAPKHGGEGLPIGAMAAILEEVAASGGALDACSALHVPMLALPVLARWASESQQERFIPAIARGEIYTTFGVTEPNAGTDTTRVETLAEPSADGFVVNGQKIWNTGALRADRMLLVARTSPRDDARAGKGLSLFMLDLRSPGVTIQRIPKIGRNAVASAEVFLQDVEIPAEDLVGIKDEGFYHLLAGLNGERLLVAAECLGMGRWLLGRATDYASERVVFGRPIGKNQAVQHPLAESYLELLAASHVTAAGLAAFESSQGTTEQEVGGLANAAKYLSSEASFRIADRAMQVFGGFSYAREYHIGRHWIETRLPRFAPVANQLVLSYTAEKILGLPRSY